ncbi:Imm21 family immunity protein [Streptomyces sp. NPDC058430]|uniref:Imm21 family immunity protein n=1 Tax=Streptomyces sp. NPDC058430 TaxID=3346495 RepID=UPI00364D57C7
MSARGQPFPSASPSEHGAFLRRLAADTEAEMKAAARTVLAGAVTQPEECGTRASDRPATLTDSAATGAEPDIEYPRGGMPTQASVPLPASRWKVRDTHTKADEETRGAPNMKDKGKLRYVVEQTFALHHFKRLAVRWERRTELHDALVSLACSLICRRRLKKTRSCRVTSA